MKDSGYLLSYLRYGDNDAILHCFTQNTGFQSYFVRGIYSTKNKKKAYLAPLNELTFITNDYQKSGLSTITKIEGVDTVEANDVRISSVLFFIADFLHQVLKKELNQEVIYQSIKFFLVEIEKGNFLAYYLFLINFLRLQGLMPLWGDARFLDPETGRFGAMQSHHFFDENISYLWKKCLEEDDIYGVKIPKEHRGNFLDSILLYYSYHFPEFRIPKSLEVLKEVFQ